MIFATVLVALALVLAWPVPRVLARMTTFRRAPRAALVIWQSVTIAAVLSALAATPVVLLEIGEEAMEGPGSARALATVGAVLSGLMLARVLVSGHQIGTRLRATRRRHRDLVDLLSNAPEVRNELGDPQLCVLQHAMPTAYCVPGLRSRVVLSQGTIDALSAAEVGAVLAHERAHLRERHDLILEFFSVMYTALPPILRSPEALSEVRLLAEVLADRSAVKAVGPVVVARAVVTMAGSSAPDAAMGVGCSTARIRLDLLHEAKRPLILLSLLMFGFAALALGAPISIVVAGWTTR
jgi:Zn-dependent protease with chaperone function